MARIAATRHFSNTLRRMIDDHFDGNMSELSRKSKVAMGTIGHYVRPGQEGRFPSTAAAEKIMRAMPEEARLELVCAMVADVVPKTYLDRVEIRPAKGEKAAAVPLLNGAPDPARKAADFLVGLAAESMEVRKMLESMAKALQSIGSGTDISKK